MRFFITGTGTGVGKTFVATVLALKLGWHYWKPVQTGSMEGEVDSIWVSHFLSQERVYPEVYRFAAPLAPSLAAIMEGREVEISHVLHFLPKEDVVIEGAGGVLVPLNSRDLMVDLILALDCPVIVVARSALGAINHSLLTIESLRARGVSKIGLLFIGESRIADQKEIQKFARVPILGAIPFLKQISREALLAAGKEIGLEVLWNKSGIY